MKIIQTSNTVKFSSHQLVNRKQNLVSKTTSTLKIESLERGDHHSEIRCAAINTNLTRPPEKSNRGRKAVNIDIYIKRSHEKIADWQAQLDKMRKTMAKKDCDTLYNKITAL